MALPAAQLKQLVLDAKLVDSQKLAAAEAAAVTSDRPLSQILVDQGLLSDAQLGQIIATAIKVPLVDLSKQTIPEALYNLIPERLAHRYQVIAFARDTSGIKVAMADPTQTTVLQQLAKKTGAKIYAYYATDADISTALLSYKKDLQKAVDDLLKEDIWTAKTIREDPPVAKIVDLMIDTAYQEKASDIHIEPQEDYSLVRFRIDGVLRDMVSAPKSLHDRIITRIKVISNLRTDEHLSAQDGKMQIQLEEEDLDIRVSIVPIADGEKAVLRLLSSKSRQYTLTDLGMNETDLAKVTRAFGKSYGMILSTGPTGSGKTTSIYSILKILNIREKNITTIEDPVEYRIKGANQIQVNVKTNLTFANGLRSILRQDPNVIFVGEIRDAETAGIAVNAALTGHLVLSTLHTNDAATAIPRLSDMKVEPFLVASTVTVIVAQRLVRKICSHCDKEIEGSLEELSKHFPPELIKATFTSKKLSLHQGQGCKICRNSGYHGRVGLFEVLEVSKSIRKLITDKADSDVITKSAIAEGMRTMLQDGLAKVAAGVTTVDEILRVTKSEFLS